ncbi:hypothetical protein BT93_C1921 [Corymbia citriodora subsp. variegata]|nr:hypothetical protein BT93_C1921 [Corymbia citriodora subsp. variegata]KAF8036074.1 hypothetical protein BT93_C1921 [Corymbia citriodora subsp. variegata]KAF8036075.1 hypothetical protein BT93_C1921 [Corymbia citriodora subsp. variegata]
MATESRPGVMKVKLGGSALGRKMESSSSRDPVASSKHKSTSAVVKTEVKSKTTPSSSKTTARTTTTKVREKKVFSLPGQKHDPPEEREPLRIFYESLSKQIPTSEMAEFWMMEHGLLSPERAKRAYEKKQKKQKQIRTGTPVKSPYTSSKPESSQKQQASKNGDLKAKKRIIQDSDDDDDFILSHRRRKM